MSDRYIHGQKLEVTVVAGYELRESVTYVCLEYCNKIYRTKACKASGKNPVYQDTFNLVLVEGVREINVTVWAKNTFTEDEVIAIGTVHLEEVLRHGSHDSLWPLQFHSRNGGHIRHGGQIKLAMTYRNHYHHQTATYAAPPPIATYSGQPLPPPQPAYQTYQMSYQPPPQPYPTSTHSYSFPPPSPLHPPVQSAPQYYPPTYPDHPPGWCHQCSGHHF